MLLETDFCPRVLGFKDRSTAGYCIVSCNCRVMSKYADSLGKWSESLQRAAEEGLTS